MTDLGTVDGDPNSIAYGINSEGQIVGTSLDSNFNFLHAFLWESGSIADLNALIPTGSGVQLTAAPGVNEHGEIVAQGVLANGDLHAFVLLPCDEHHPGLEGCDYSLVAGNVAPATASPAPSTENSSTRTQLAPSFSVRTNPMLRRFGRGLGPSTYRAVQTPPNR